VSVHMIVQSYAFSISDIITHDWYDLE